MARRQANKLTVKGIEAIAEPGLYGDGGTLYLRVRDSGSRSWVQIIQTGGGRMERGLGSYPLVSLQEARDTAFENRRALRRGENPFATPNPLAAAISNGAVPASNAPTFREALEAYLETHSPTWRNPATEADWRASLRDYAMPAIGKMRVDAVTSADVMAVLEPIWRVKHDTARKVKQRIHAIMEWAIAYRHRADNPVAAVGRALPKVQVSRKHHEALPYAEVPQAIAAIRQGKGSAGVKCALEFLILTAGRSGEVRAATWGEIDRKAKTWTIPAGRMKAGAEHVVPLPNAAVDVLEAVAAELGEGDDGELIFPSPRGGKVLQGKAFERMLRDNGVDATVHGFRSSFADWAAETGVRREVKEAALAHSVRSETEGAYTRTNYVAERREVMQAWAKHCEPKAKRKAKGGGKQVELV